MSNIGWLPSNYPMPSVKNGNKIYECEAQGFAKQIRDAVRKAAIVRSNY